MNDNANAKKLIDALYTTVCDSVPVGSRDDRVVRKVVEMWGEDPSEEAC